MNDHDMLAEAYGAALSSRDPSTQNGAVIAKGGFVLARGCNNFPPDVVETEERWRRPLKYEYVEHAERAVIFACARYGGLCAGSAMYCPWAPCCACGRAIILAGIATFVVHEDRLAVGHGDWRKNVELAMGMLGEAGVAVRLFRGPVDAAPVLADGRLWCPRSLSFIAG